MNLVSVKLVIVPLILLLMVSAFVAPLVLRVRHVRVRISS